MENNLAPLIIFVYNRPEHTEAMLQSVSRLIKKEETDLFIFSDGYKNDSDKVSVEKVRTVIKNFSISSGFKSVSIEESPKNCGLADSIISGVSKIFAKYKNVIVLEDDLIVSRYFLEYMNSALRFYESKNIWAISGYSFPMKVMDIYNHDVFVSGRACSWGWGTWKNRWDTVDWAISDYSYFKNNLALRWKFCKWGFDLADMLDRCMSGENSSWAIRWCYSGFRQGKMTIYPKESLVLNIGTDGSGTNFTEACNRFRTILSEKSSFRLEDVDEFGSIRIAFRKHYTPLMLRLKIWLRVLFRYL